MDDLISEYPVHITYHCKDFHSMIILLSEKTEIQLQKFEKKSLVRGNQKEGWMIEIGVTVNL